MQASVDYIKPMQVVKRTGAVIEVIPETEQNDVDIQALEHSILHGKGRPALLAFTHIATNSGPPDAFCNGLASCMNGTHLNGLGSTAL